jgi:hypothetical protein
MTMYLPNDEVRPTGAELAEFIDAPSDAERPSPARRPGSSSTPESDDGDAPNGAATLDT